MAENVQETTLTLSSQPVELDSGITVDLEVTTDAVDYEVEVENTEYLTATKDGMTIRLNTIKDGTSKITVSATAPGLTTKKVIWYLGVKTNPTVLTLDEANRPTNLVVGQSVELPIVTNCPSYTITFGERDVVVLGSKPNAIRAIGIGKTKITITATKPNSTVETVEWVTNVTGYVASNSDGTPTNLKLVNPTTKKVITIQTSGNTSYNDVTISLPSTSGTLLTEESLTEGSVIPTPYITSPANGTPNFTGKFVGSDFEIMDGYNIGITYSEWQVARDREFAEVIYTKKQYPSEQLPDGVTTYLGGAGAGACYVRVRYVADKYTSGWSYGIYVQLGLPSPHGIKEPLKVYTKPENANKYPAPTGMTKLADYRDGAYFGYVSKDLLSPCGYDYRGTFKTVKEKFTPSNYQDTTNCWRIVDAKAGQQYLHNGVLYRCLQNKTYTSKESMVEPDVDTDYWKVEDREHLVHASELVNIVGYTLNLNDGNHDGYSSGVAWIGYDHGTMAYQGTNYNQMDYIKYVYNGKLCYMPAKQIVNGICWNDLMRRDAAMYNKTVRLGKHLYWIRLPFEEEINELFGRMKDGTYDTKTPTELGFRNDTYDYIWIHDTRAQSTKKKIIVKQDGTIETIEQDPKSRSNVNWRPVLEYIPEGDEPYNNLEKYFGNLPKAENENFQYDPYSDTGYFGIVPWRDMVTGDELCARVRFSSGTIQNQWVNWIKFYWHGQIVYMPLGGYRYSCTFNQLVSANLLLGFEGVTGKFVSILNNKFRVCQPTGFDKEPYDYRRINHSLSNGNGKIPHANILTDSNRYSMWAELMFRVGNYYSGFEEVHTVNFLSELDEICGFQRGDFWVQLPVGVLKTDYNQGNGTDTWVRDKTTNGSSRYAGIFGQRGVSRSYTTTSKDDTGSARSWRPCLIADRIDIGLHDNYTIL